MEIDGCKPFVTPVQVKGSIRSFASSAELNVEVRYAYSMPCNRCLTLTRKELCHNISHVIVNKLNDEEDFEDYIVIDGEAGIEQINRRVMEKITHLVLITDTSRKGTQVVQTIRKVADELVMYEQAGVIINRVPDESIVQYMDLGDLPVLSVIPSDSSLAEFDLKGENVFYLSDDAAIVRGAREALKKLEIL